MDQELYKEATSNLTLVRDFTNSDEFKQKIHPMQQAILRVQLVQAAATLALASDGIIELPPPPPSIPTGPLDRHGRPAQLPAEPDQGPEFGPHPDNTLPGQDKPVIDNTLPERGHASHLPAGGEDEDEKEPGDLPDAAIDDFDAQLKREEDAENAEKHKKGGDKHK